MNPQKRKSSFFVILFLCKTMLWFAGCANKAPQTLEQPIARANVGSTQSVWGVRLTNQGYNRDPHFSPSGRKIVFSSKDRDSHLQSQIYEFDFESVRERRITFQDGACHDPLYLENDNQIIYSSTTDEMKERPALFYPPMGPASFPGSELYLSDVLGNKIDRLTDSPGFQGLTSISPERKPALVFSSFADDKMSLSRLSLETGKVLRVGLPQKDFILSPLMSSTGAYLWIQRSRNESEDTERTDDQLMVGRPGNSPQNLDFPAKKINFLQWIDPREQKLIVSAQMKGSQYSQIYFYDLSKKCTRPLVTGEAHIESADINLKYSKIVFSVLENVKRADLFVRDFQVTYLACSL